jgi:hypothetical protein
MESIGSIELMYFRDIQRNNIVLLLVQMNDRIRLDQVIVRIENPSNTGASQFWNGQEGRGSFAEVFTLIFEQIFVEIAPGGFIIADMSRLNVGHRDIIRFERFGDRSRQEMMDAFLSRSNFTEQIPHQPSEGFRFSRVLIVVAPFGIGDIITRPRLSAVVVAYPCVTA